MRLLWVARCCRTLGVLWPQMGHFQQPASNSVGKVLPLLWNAGHTVSSFLALAEGAERRGDSSDCETWSKNVKNLKVKCAQENCWAGEAIKFDHQGCHYLEKRWKILNMLTFELLRFLADLSAGLTGSVAAAGGEVRGRESCNCETWNKTVNNRKVKLWSRELLSWGGTQRWFSLP